MWSDTQFDPPSNVLNTPSRNAMSKAHVKGHMKEAEGRIKEVAGKLVGNERLEEKGKAEKIAGKHEAARADLKDDIKKLAGA
jgi:uncharacterized protein YjbJ (UPF0337 family)